MYFHKAHSSVAVHVEAQQEAESISQKPRSKVTVLASYSVADRDGIFLTSQTVNVDYVRAQFRVILSLETLAGLGTGILWKLKP